MRKPKIYEADLETDSEPDEGPERVPYPSGSGDGKPSDREPLEPETLERASLQLDRLIHERIRLAIVSALAVNDTLTFNDLKAFLRTTDGNLSVHARKLEDAGYLVCEKTFKGRLPRTHYRLTRTGRGALERYLGHMEAIIRATRRG